jgi:tRNA(Ile)-lysidine synthase
MRAAANPSDPSTHLAAALGTLPPGPLAVALSGGLDSTVLLHALTALPAARERGVRALHVDHHLHPASGEWAAHCRAICAALDVPLAVLEVEVDRGADHGLEAAARDARHAALSGAMAPGEILVLAHQRDDQAETVLLKLLRGAGPEGLGAMRGLRAFGPGRLWRPLLDLPRAALRAHALRHRLAWIEDPGNAQPAFDRNFLRHDVLPRLRERWPQADASLAHSARWLRDTAQFVDDETATALARIGRDEGATLDVGGWLALAPALRDPVLRAWLRSKGLAEPTRVQVGELVRQLATARQDRTPCVGWSGIELRRYRDRLHAWVPTPLPPAGWESGFDGAPLELPGGLGHVRLAGADASAATVRLPAALQLRFPRGGERLRPAGSKHERALRKLWQEAGVPPWQRLRTPLVCDAGGELLAVCGLCVSANGAALFASHRARLILERNA